MKRILKKTLLLSISIHMLSAAALACTGIILRADDGAVIPARTMEFGFDIDSNILVVPAGTEITKLIMDDNNTGGSYIAKYGFAGANALDKPIVIDGVNEQGLYFGGFYFTNLAEYEELTKANRSEAISSEELGNYILSQFATVAEVKEAIPDLVIVGTYIKKIDGFAPFHYAVTDRSGESIVIEFTKDGVAIFDNTVNVITNNPTYDWHLTNLNNYIGLTTVNRGERLVGRQMLKPFGEGTGLLGAPGDYSSPSRFVRAAAFVNSALVPETAADGIFSAFHILNNFDIPKGSVRGYNDDKLMAEYTIWTSAVNTQKPEYYYKTYLTQRVEKIDLAVALENLTEPKVITMETGFSVVDRSAD